LRMASCLRLPGLGWTVNFPLFLRKHEPRRDAGVPFRQRKEWNLFRSTVVPYSAVFSTSSPVLRVPRTSGRCRDIHVSVPAHQTATLLTSTAACLFPIRFLAETEKSMQHKRERGTGEEKRRGNTCCGAHDIIAGGCLSCHRRPTEALHYVLPPNAKPCHLSVAARPNKATVALYVFVWKKKKQKATQKKGIPCLWSVEFLASPSKINLRHFLLMSSWKTLHLPW